MITVLLGLLLAITLIFAISSRHAGGPPQMFGHQMYVVLSGSMEPKIHTGSIIITKPYAANETLKVGDVVTFQAPDSPDTLITHRIHEIHNTGGTAEYVTKGDANDSADSSPVQASAIIARYSNLTIPYLGYYIEFLKTKLGLALLLIIPGLLLMLLSIIEVIREILKLEKNAKAKESTIST
ncbi:signal peptidase I [Paenibacillus albus]|uniref:Signal peptidase I n=2 Tax=Paenibacillus albus TaxID=2495582 RepID=A0A3S9AD56_9BACL|nr:signal peptidase I [Paenibacillus albus]